MNRKGKAERGREERGLSWSPLSSQRGYEREREILNGGKDIEIVDRLVQT